MEKEKHMKPRKNPDIAEKIGAETLIFSINAGRLYELNELGKIIWSLCDGNNTVEEMSELIIKQEKYNISKTKILEDTYKFIKKLEELSLILI